MRGVIVAMAAAGLVIAGCGQSSGAVAANEQTPVDMTAARSGVYVPDPGHRAILFSYDHQGYSTSYVRWRDWTGELTWNAERPEASSIVVTINAEKVDSGVDVFDDHLRGARFFDTANHPTITFVSTALARTGANTGTLTGDLTIKGVTKPVTLDVTINKAEFVQRGNAYKLGFSAKGAIMRSAFGLDAAVPIVGDEVTLTIESEFVSPNASE